MRADHPVAWGGRLLLGIGPLTTWPAYALHIGLFESSSCETYVFKMRNFVLSITTNSDCNEHFLNAVLGCPLGEFHIAYLEHCFVPNWQE